MAFFLISRIVLGLLDQLQILRYLYLIELLGFLTGLKLLKLQHLIYPRLSVEFSILVIFTNLGLFVFQARYLALFFLFLVIANFGWFWMGKRHKSIQLLLEFLNGSIHGTSMTFLMMLSIILLSTLMMLCI